MNAPSSSPFAERVVEMISLGSVDVDLFAWLAGELDRNLGTRFRLAAAVPLRPEWRDPESDQFSSNALVDHLADREVASAVWSLGVTEADLVAPDRAFVFGEATLGGCCAVISLARLKPLPDAGEGPADLRRRIYREAVHELGHVAGLNHCEEDVCVMVAAAGVADVDRAGTAFCGTCRRQLRFSPGG